MQNTSKVLAVVIGASIALTACAGPPGDSNQNGDEDLRKVVIRTDYMFNGYVTPYALALERGYFEEEGLDVSIEIGQGSATTVQTVASGQDQFGIADSGTVVKAISNEGIPVKVVSVHLQQIPMGFIHKPENAVKTPDDVAERVIVSSAGAAELSLLPAITSQAGIDVKSLETQLVGAESRIAQFLNTKNAVLLGFATGDYLRAKAEDPSITYTSYATFGLSAYGTGLITHANTIATDPDLVEKVVRAVQRGWADAVDDPEAAVAAGMKIQPDADEGLLLEGLQVAIDELLHTKRTEGKPLGWTSDEDWKDMLEMFHEYAGMAKPKDISEYYSNEFIPKS